MLKPLTQAKDLVLPHDRNLPIGQKLVFVVSLKVTVKVALSNAVESLRSE